MAGGEGDLNSEGDRDVNRFVPCAAMLLAIGAGLSTAGDATKMKSKGDTVVVADKSKPVRAALEAQYARLAEAVRNKDFEAFQGLRTADFSTINEKGERKSAAEMAERARALLERIQPPIETSNTIGTIDLEGDRAVATVRQRFVRMQEMAGTLRKVETRVTQDETWVLTAEGWKLQFVENVRDPEQWVDGKRVDPAKPYDPDAPPFEPPGEP